VEEVIGEEVNGINEEEYEALKITKEIGES
jgi:hypothetical protein